MTERKRRTRKPPEEAIRERLLTVAEALLQEKGSPDAVTLRDIAARAETALGLVHYHFGSRDNLMAEVIGRRMSALAAGMLADAEGDAPPRVRLEHMLCRMVHFGMDYLDWMQSAVRHILLTGATDAQALLLPLVRAHFQSEPRSETELRLMVHQWVTVLQLAALNPTAFAAFTGLDPLDAKQREEAVRMLLNSHLGESAVPASMQKSSKPKSR